MDQEVQTTSQTGINKIWHLCTPGNSKNIIFRNTADFIEGMNISGISAAKFRDLISILTFELMNNHIHYIIKGEEADTIEFFKYFHSKLRRMLLRQNRISDIGKPEFDIFRIDSEKYLRNVIIYVNRNGYVINPKETPFSYEWGANRYFFNHTQSTEEKFFLKEMHKRNRMAYFHTRDIDFPDDYYLTNGYISPLCYCQISESEKIFRNAHQYFSLISKNIESFNDIATQLGDKIFYTDDELFTAVFHFIRKQFDKDDINSLNINEKIAVAKNMHFNFNASNKQIARILKISAPIIDELFPYSR